MDVTFGLFLDGYRRLSHESSLGAVTVGPQGLLGLLETRLGLGGVWQPHPVRVAQYRRCLAAADKGGRFYAVSFEIDALAVAETLLGWRDDWIAAGWDRTAHASDSARLRDLAEVEVHAGDGLDAGFADRLQAVTAALSSRNPGIEVVRLLDPLDHLPPMWQRVLETLPARKELLARHGAAEPAGNNLAALQAALVSNTPCSLRPEDSSVLMLTADSEQTLATAVANALASPGGWSVSGTTAIVGQRGAVLDQALGAAGLPRAGQSDSTTARPALQVLGMALSLLWTPLDPRLLLEFLAHPVCPVRQPLRSWLAQVVAETPGIGGEIWRGVIEKARERAVAKPNGEKSAGRVIDEQVAQWLEVQRFNAGEGAPTTALAEHCAHVASWAGMQANSLEEEDARRLPYFSAQAQASSAAAALDELARGGVERCSRLQLDRLVDQVTSGGSSRPDVDSKCGHMHTVAHAGAVHEDVARLLWWDFSPPGSARRWPWTPREIAELGDHGASLASIDKMRQLEARAWLRPVLAAREQLVLALPRRRGNEAVAPHPLWDQIVALVKMGAVTTVDLDRDLAQDVTHDWLSTCAIPGRSLPARKRWWTLPDGSALPRRDSESFSSLSNFVHTPHRWVLSYRAKLRSGRLDDIAQGNRLKGSLLHRLLEWLFADDRLDWRTLTRNDLRDWMNTRLPELLAQEGAQLLLRGHGYELESLRATAIDSAWALIGHLRGADAHSVKMEEPVQGQFRGGALQGRIDMLVANGEGTEAVLDIKWGSEKYRRAELQENRQLQLATYAAMRQRETRQWPSCGYFILEDARLLAQDNGYFERAFVCAPANPAANTQTLWSAFEKTWSWRRAQLNAGLIEINAEHTEPDERSEPPEGALAIAEPRDSWDEYACLLGWPQGA
ncbi:MAG: PD-(D/E)XK nuclease family protein [Gammaproteobacteria bacterium]